MLNKPLIIRYNISVGFEEDNKHSRFDFSPSKDLRLQATKTSGKMHVKEIQAAKLEAQTAKQAAQASNTQQQQVHSSCKLEYTAIA